MWKQHANCDYLIFNNLCRLPAGVSDGQEHAEVTVGYDAQRHEKNKAAQHQRVAFIGRSGGHVVPRARRHQPLWDVRTFGHKDCNYTAGLTAEVNSPAGGGGVTYSSPGAAQGSRLASTARPGLCRYTCASWRSTVWPAGVWWSQCSDQLRWSGGWSWRLFQTRLRRKRRFYSLQRN